MILTQVLVFTGNRREGCALSNRPPPGEGSNSDTIHITRGNSHDGAESARS